MRVCVKRCVRCLIVWLFVNVFFLMWFGSGLRLLYEVLVGRFCVYVVRFCDLVGGGCDW